MAVRRWERPDDHDDVLLLAAAEDAHRRRLRERLASVHGTKKPGVYPRFRIVQAGAGAEALRRAPRATLAAVNLTLPGKPALDVIRALRDAQPTLAILAYALRPSASDAMAAIMAGADFFQDAGEASVDALVEAMDRALERRSLTRSLEVHEAEAERTRGELAQLSGELGALATGLWPLRSARDVLPFREAARRYLLSARAYYARDPRGLASALGVSYFALRRLLARYDVPFPAVRGRVSDRDASRSRGRAP
jgi:DNA-binding NarL/FixJ family response regulator